MKKNNLKTGLICQTDGARRANQPKRSDMQERNPKTSPKTKGKK